LTALLNDVEKKYRVDKDRIYVSGLSMGGFGTWSLSAYTPYRFAALVPICGGGEKFWVKKVKHVPIWVFHGGKDTAVPIERSQTLVDELKKAKADVSFTIRSKTSHAIAPSNYSSVSTPTSNRTAGQTQTSPPSWPCVNPATPF